ncbi:MAG: plastocyanin/azurin family copper-binding protein [Nitrospiria bacterium]
MMFFVGRTFFAVGFLAVFFSVQGCDFLPDPQRRKVAILLNSSEMGESAFSPNPVVVHLGGRVVWRNDDVLEHAIKGDAKQGPCAFESGPIGYGERYSQSFFERVTCNYYCALHGRTMRGRIIVE